MNPTSRWWTTLFSVMLLGCAAAAPHRHAATTSDAATTQPLSDKPRTIHFSDAALPIDRFRDDDHDIDLRNVINFDKHGDVYFGQVDRTNQDGDTTATLPIVVALQKGAWL